MNDLIKTEYGTYYHPDDPGENGYEGNPKRRSITDQEADKLKELVRDKIVLEIGTGTGFSTHSMAETAVKIVSVDIDPWTHSFEFPDNVSLYDHIPDGHYDVAFIDGYHEYQSVKNDIERCSKVADILILHDGYLEDVMRAINDSDVKINEIIETECKLVICSPL